MKEIKAYVRPERADDVIQALEEVGIHGMTVIDVTA
ncbi:MAG: P-II family nitrogen regulator, partial [Candidatus Marinimicrobia bacterium]|nr:P-II family nitrogen regulator [Candidatus Neomarinimicrobiota bacterium]